MCGPAKLSAMLAAQAPAWTPGIGMAITPSVGWYRRTDSPRRPCRAFPWPVFADEVAEPLGLDFHIGLPVSVDRDRVAHLHCWSRAEMMLHLNVMPVRSVAASFYPRSLALRAFTIARGL